MKILKSISTIITFYLCLGITNAFSMEVERGITEIELSDSDQKVLKSIKSTANFLDNKGVGSEISSVVDSILSGQSEVQFAMVEGVILSKADTTTLNAIKKVADLLQNHEIKDRIDELVNTYIEPTQKKTTFEEEYDVNIPDLMGKMENLLGWKDEKQKVLEIAQSKTVMQALDNSKPGMLLMLAADWDSDIVEAFIRAGLKPNIKTELEHEYPLHHAAAAGRGNMVEVLLKAGAEKNIQNSTGKTPYELALERKRNMDEVIDQTKKKRETEKRPYLAPAPYDQFEYKNAVKAVDLLK